MRYELWQEDPLRKRGGWAVFGVDENYERQLAVNAPELKFSRAFEAASFDQAMGLVHEYLGLPRYLPPKFE
jgi:hypothetical protein